MHRTFLVGAPIAVALVVLSLGYVFAQANEQDSPCITGEAVYEWDLGTGLVADCEALLAAKDALRGTASLNWSADRFIERWDGIGVGQSRRVETIELHRQGLNGSIPSEISSLDHLVELKLYANDLTGPLPPALGDLANLEVLQLNDNQLSGQIPETLNSLNNLRTLSLSGNSFTGCVPANLLNVRTNDVSRLGLPTCTGAVSTPTPPAATPTATSVPPPGATPQPTPPPAQPTATPTMPPPTASPTPRPESLSEMVRRVRPAVVKITTTDTVFATGSGVIYRTDSRNRAYILTNHHVVDEALQQLSVQVGDADWFTPEVLHMDPRRDLAVLRICCGAFTSVEFADSDTLFAGDDVIAIGYPVDRLMPRRRVIVPGEASVTRGIISAFRYSTRWDAQLVQNDAPLNPGNSGGPIFTPQGEIVGLNTFRLIDEENRPFENIGFAVLETTIQERLRLWASDPADSFGPVSGELSHELDGRIERWAPVFKATEDEFVLSATFANPYGVADHHWDYGFQFGITDDLEDKFLSIVVRSDELWQVLLYAGGSVETLYFGSIPSLRTGAGEENRLVFRVDGPYGWLYVNDEKVQSYDDYHPVKYLDLGLTHVTSHEGSVAVGTGFLTGSERAGAVTRYKDFQGETYDRE